MSKFFGYEPKPKTAKLADEFETKVLIRRNNKSLVGRVFVDIMDDEWKFAVGFNQMGITKLHIRVNEFEVLYSIPDITRIKSEFRLATQSVLL